MAQGTPAKLILATAIKWMVFTGIFYGVLLYGGLRAFWESYWLTKDSQPGVAIILAERQHGLVDYKYKVGQQEYTGRSHRNWKQEKYRNVGVGEQSVVYISTSHPWISSLEEPSFPPSGTVVYLAGPVVLLVFAILGLRSARTKRERPGG
jgi:hypothetical protein